MTNLLIILLLSGILCLMGLLAFQWQKKRDVLRNQRSTMGVLTQMFPDNVLVADHDGVIVAFSPSACEFFGYEPDEFRGLSVEALMPQHLVEQHREHRKKMYQSGPGKAMNNEVACLSKTGDEIPAITRVRTFELDGHTYGLVSIQDLRVFKSREENLRKLSEHDPLTGLANRRLFDHDYRREWHRAVREQAYLAVLMIDVDFFKEYNDYHGHPAGDACLRRIAGLLSDHMQRATDSLARYGGEEFICLLPGVNPEEAEEKAVLLREEVLRAAIPHGRSSVSPWVTVSIGCAALIPKPHDPMNFLIHAADAALYQAKAEGRNQARFYEAAQGIRSGNHCSEDSPV